MRKKLFIALPTKRYVEPECEDFLSEKVFRPNDTYEVGDFVKLRNSPNIYMQRYNLALRFLESDCDYYFYIDSDQSIVAPENAVEIMVKEDLDIVSPLIVRTVFPHLPAAMSFKQYRQFKAGKRYFEDFRKYPQDRPYEVYYSCGGIVLIARRVLQVMEKPFLPVFNDEGELLSVDYALYSKAKEFGFKCWVEPRVKAAHIGYFPFIEDDYYALLDSGQLDVEQGG